MTSAERHRTATGAARRRGETQRADGDRRVGQIIKARRALAPRVARVWPNGREVARAGARYMHRAEAEAGSNNALTATAVRVVLVITFQHRTQLLPA